jgi:curved DNA-binding protein
MLNSLNRQDNSNVNNSNMPGLQAMIFRVILETQIFLISLHLCLVEVADHKEVKKGSRDRTMKRSLKEAATTHQQTLTVNGKNIRITIHAGVENDQKIKLKGHGAPGRNGGPAGDLYITFKIREDTRFKRLGSDLYTTEHVDLYTMVLGGEVMIDTLNSKLKLKVAPGTQNGTKVRLKDKGFPVYRQEGQHGDLYVTYQVKLPTVLSEKEKELFTQLSHLK